MILTKTNVSPVLRAQFLTSLFINVLLHKQIH